VSDSLGLIEAIEQARAIDRPDLFVIPHETADPNGMGQAAVAGVAAVALRFGGDLPDAELAWTQRTIFSAAETTEKRDALWCWLKASLSPLRLRRHRPRRIDHQRNRIADFKTRLVATGPPPGRSVLHGDRRGACSVGERRPACVGRIQSPESGFRPGQGMRSLRPTGTTVRRSPTA
jgi:hypothetical protein